MAEQKVLMTAANGMKVWVPLDKLEEWKAAQADQSPEAIQRRQTRAKEMLSFLSTLSSKAPETSE